MKLLQNKLGAAGTVTALLILAGCLLSGTFVSVILIRNQDFTTRTGFYYHRVDLSDDEVWKDHKDDIKDIELVGFELWITNDESQAHTFNIYIDDIKQPAYTTRAEVEANTTLVLDGLTLRPGPDVQTRVSYGQSFKYLRNVNFLKAMAHRDGFHYYGLTKLGTTAGFTIDTLRVIVTFNAGK